MLWRTLFCPEKNNLLVCDNDEKCHEFSAHLQAILKHKTIQQLFYGMDYEIRNDNILINSIGQIINKDKIVESYLNKNRQPNITVVTVMSSLTGSHFNGVVIFDDAFISQKAHSRHIQETRKGACRDFLALAPDADTWILGTRYTKYDEYQRIEDEEVPDGFFVTNKNSRSAEKNGVALWPEKYPLDKLGEIRRSIGEVQYRLQYLNDVTALSGAFFNEVLIHNAMIDEIPKGVNSAPAIIGLDMAYGGADYTSMVKAVVYDGIIYIIDSLNKNYKEITQKYRDLSSFNIDRKPIIIENNGPQKENCNWLRQQGYRVYEYVPRGNKAERLSENIAPMLEQGKLKIYTPKCRDLIDQMMNYTGDDSEGHDDLLDALMLVCNKINSTSFDSRPLFLKGIDVTDMEMRGTEYISRGAMWGSRDTSIEQLI
jgi:hypothetical protein